MLVRSKIMLRRLLERATGVRALDLRETQAQVKVLESRIEALERNGKRLERVLDFICIDSTSRWLYSGRAERMDATVDIFDEIRRRFHLARYEFAAGRVHGKRVLDCACGTGYGVRLLREQGRAENVLGVDLDPMAIQYARSNHRPPGTDYSCASATTLPLEAQSFDAVTSFETIEHMEDAEGLLAEFHRVLAPFGILIISTPNQWPLEIAPHHVRVFDPESFRAMLSGAGFDLLELWNQNSGADWLHNHGQPAGFVETTPENEALAECLVAICRRRATDRSD